MPPTFGGAAATCPRCAKAVYFNEQVVGPGGMYHKPCLTCKECRKRLDSTNVADKDKEAYCKNCYGRLFGPKGYGYGSGAGVLSTDTALSPGTGSAPASATAASPAASATSATSPAAATPSMASTAARAMFEASGGAGVDRSAASPASPASPVKSPASATTAGPRPASATASKYGGADTCSRCAKAVYFAEQVIGPGNLKYHKACFKCSECNKQLDTGTVVNKDTTIFCKPCHGRKFGPRAMALAVAPVCSTPSGLADLAQLGQQRRLSLS
ncbi:hypothetical protein BC831DRAFT_499813 [Entophlyctis helioformis]|nr:hypothetical protein BC831DRAFT_499813 [Entophlyctis helioformis]